jgi:hypothetical protein
MFGGDDFGSVVEVVSSILSLKNANKSAESTGISGEHG